MQEFGTSCVCDESIGGWACCIFHPQGIGLFNITVKNHILCHIAADSYNLNPAKSWCFASEDFLQKFACWCNALHMDRPLHTSKG